MEKIKILFHGKEVRVVKNFQSKVGPKHYVSVFSLKTGTKSKIVHISEFPNHLKDSPRFNPHNGICVEIKVQPGKEREIENWLLSLGYRPQVKNKEWINMWVWTFIYSLLQPMPHESEAF